MNKIIIIASVFVGVLSPRGGGILVDAFVQMHSKLNEVERTRPTAAGALLATKHIVIGGNIDGINPNQDEDTYNMSKKERRRREREKGAANFKKGKHKKKKSFVINYDKLEEKVTKERTLLPREMNNSGVKSNLGVPSTRKKKKVEKKLSVKSARILKQRTAGGTVNSTSETILPQSPEKQAIEIRIAKRSNKTVTMVQGMTLPMKDRKILLKEMKAKLGGGGTVVEGVLELQGSHTERILDILKSKGYSQAKVVGGKK
ncbi:hypothetical protein ACHAXR_013217 [Thalassiosira sp. AJA248-18]